MERCRFIVYENATLCCFISWQWAVSCSLWRAAWPPCCVSGQPWPEEEHSGEMASGWRNQFLFWLRASLSGFVILWHIVSAAVKGTRGQLSSKAIVPHGDLPLPVSCSYWAMSKFQVIKWIGFLSHCDIRLDTPAESSWQVRLAMLGSPTLVSTPPGGDWWGKALYIFGSSCTWGANYSLFKFAFVTNHSFHCARTVRATKSTSENKMLLILHLYYSGTGNLFSFLS